MPERFTRETRSRGARRNPVATYPEENRRGAVRLERHTHGRSAQYRQIGDVRKRYKRSMEPTPSTEHGQVRMMMPLTLEPFGSSNQRETSLCMQRLNHQIGPVNETLNTL